MARNTSNVLFNDDSLEFEPYKTFTKNFMHWFTPYMLDVFKNQSKRKIKDLDLHKSLTRKFASLEKIEDMRELINELAQNGFKGPKTYFNPNKAFFVRLMHKLSER